MATVTKKKTTKKKKVVTKKEEFVPQIYKEDIQDPRRTLFEAYYTDPLSPTFGVGRSSAIRAGFSRSYADNLFHLRPAWLSVIIGRKENIDLLEIARKNIKEFLVMDVSEHAVGIGGHLYDKDEFGKKTIPVIVDNTKKMEIKNKTTLFVAEKMDPSFNKMNKKDEDSKIMVDFKQVIIINPNGQGIAYNSTGTETIPSVRETA